MAREPEGSGPRFAIVVMLFVAFLTAALTAVLLGESLHRRWGLRKLVSELGPVRYFPFPYVTLDEIRDHYSRDRDADDADDPANQKACFFCDW